MKLKGLSVMVAAAILSGCTGMMYGGGVAPVNNQNTYYGRQQQPMQGWQQQPQQARNAYANTRIGVNTAQQQQAQAEALRQQQEAEARRQAEIARQQAQQAQTQAATQATAASPYGNAGPANTAPNPAQNAANDGWAVRPNTPPTATDMPKVEPQAPMATPVANRQEPQPIRPPAREDNSQNAQAQAPSTPQQATQASPAQEPARQVAAAQPAGERPAASGGSAVSSLLQKANSELGKGNLDGAAAYLEDAHRIDSKNANILYDIANIRYHQKRYREAEAAAARAANMGGNNSVMRKSWSLIANARKALGDNQGAIAASEKAASF